jgi:hypothetical protein
MLIELFGHNSCVRTVQAEKMNWHRILGCITSNEIQTT